MSRSRTLEAGGGANFCRNFLTTLFRRFPDKVRHFHVLNVFMYGIFRRASKSVADINTGSPKALLFDIFTVLSFLFLPPRGGANSIDNFDGWAMAGFARLDPPLSRGHELVSRAHDIKYFTYMSLYWLPTIVR